MKRFLDSVHGYILIPDEYCDKIIDTVYFQRLRRIEQTSSRSLFPSARHDRFIHSLGVYYIGSLILEELGKKNDISVDKDKYELITKSYEMACLLHDIGHSPFSHTFEDYYSEKECLDDNHNLRNLLINIFKENTTFKNECKGMLKITPHEFMGAIIAATEFGQVINDNGGSVELVVRMIIGCYYKDIYDYSLENAFIDLIHGELIDADSLDYVCRDSWASGYSTVTIDIERLVSSISICKNKDETYHVCFSPKAINEISKALEVKTFQQFNVIYHHTVVYDQKLLVEAMKSAAMYHFDINNKNESYRKYLDTYRINVDKDDYKQMRNYALSQLCNVESMRNTIILPHHNIPLIHPMDDDFLYLMKFCPKDTYIEQWLSRQYKLKPLWKSQAEFYNKFVILRDKRLERSSWIFSDKCKRFLMDLLNTEDEDKVWICEATPKYKSQFADKILVKVENEDDAIPYDKLLPKDRYSYDQTVQPFFYIYVDEGLLKNKGILTIMKALNEEVGKYVFTVE